jgi:hypothetical protein
MCCAGATRLYGAAGEAHVLVYAAPLPEYYLRFDDIRV